MNAKIVTLDEPELNDDPGTVAEAMAIRDDRYQAVGDRGEIDRYVGPETEVVDAGGKTILPGLIESHVHPANTVEDVAPELFEVPGMHIALRAERTPEETLDKMRSFLDEARPLQEGEWVFMNVDPNPEIEEVDSIIKLTRWSKREVDDASELEINKNHINEMTDNPMLAAVSGGRSPNLAEPGQIFRLERQDGELTREWIRGEPDDA